MVVGIRVAGGIVARITLLLPETGGVVAVYDHIAP
jgi:hypothetical protein